MTTSNYHITKEQHDTIKSFGDDRSKISKFLEDEVLSPCILYGYGFYGGSYKLGYDDAKDIYWTDEIKRRYTIEICIGSSCD